MRAFRNASRIRSSWIRMRPPAAAVQHHEPAIPQRARRGRIPARGNEPDHIAAILRNIHDRHGVRVRADHIKQFSIRTERQRARRHAERLAWSRGQVDGLHHPRLVGLGNADRVNAVGIGRRNKQPGDPGRLTFRRFVLSGQPHHVRGMRRQPHRGDQAPVRSLIVAHRAIGPTGHEKRLAVGMKQDAVGPASGFDALDHHPGLRIDHNQRIVVQVGGIDQAAVRREGSAMGESDTGLAKTKEKKSSD